MPAVSSRRVITIVGGGFAGTALALHLTRQPGSLAVDIHLIEPRATPGPGLAYGTEHLEYLLNVRADGMSVWQEEPCHFARWLVAQPESIHGAPEFAPRATYGRYLHHTLQAALQQSPANGSRLHCHSRTATAVPPLPNGQRAVRLDNGLEIISDYVVLALGNFPSPPPAGPDLRYLSHAGYHTDPWVSGGLAGIAPDETVLLIGSGLTAVDVLLGLRRAGHRAPITVVARHGRWPAVHGPATGGYPNFYPELAGLRTVAQVLAVVRRHFRAAAAQGHDWRAVLDALRPNLGHIWAAWPLVEQARFLRHLASRWSVARHRSPPQNAAAIADMAAGGRLQMQLGRVGEIVPDGTALRVQVRGGGGPDGWLRAQHVISCVGPLLDYSRIQTPVVALLRATGELVPDPLRLGICTDDHGALLNTTGAPSASLFTLGASRRPAYFESTAVPELRQQAATLAAELSRRLGA